jgi:hypothetical protein
MTAIVANTASAVGFFDDVLLVSVVIVGVVALFAGTVVAVVVTGAMPIVVVETSVSLITSLSVGVEETVEPCDVVVTASGTTVAQPATNTKESSGITNETEGCTPRYLLMRKSFS